MKKKTKLIISSFTILVIAAAVIGTVAYFSKVFTSDNNVATAATFDVDVVNEAGQTIGNGQFKLGDKLYPGMETQEVYSFQINKNNTALPVNYSVNLIPRGDLFPIDNSSPIILTLQNLVNGSWVNMDYTVPFTSLHHTEKFRVLVEWPHGDNDIDFQSKTGNVYLEVVATQADATPEPEPDGPPYITGKIDFKVDLTGAVRSTTNKEINFYVNDEGFKVIEIAMGTAAGDFEDNIGNITITEGVVRGLSYFGVITEKDKNASEKNQWLGELDLSNDGTVLFNGLRNVGGFVTYLSIESNELYDWFNN